jgi:hypothetical protein
MRVPTLRALAQNFARSYESYDVPKLVRLRSKRLGAPAPLCLRGRRMTRAPNRLTACARVGLHPRRSAVVQLRFAGGCARWAVAPARPRLTGPWTHAAVLIYVGIYSFYAQKSYQAVSDFVAASEVRLLGYVSDALNRVRPFRSSAAPAPRAEWCARQSYSPEDFSSVEGQAFFIATAVQQTPQLQGVCAGRRNASACLLRPSRAALLDADSRTVRSVGRGCRERRGGVLDSRRLRIRAAQRQRRADGRV